MYTGLFFYSFLLFLLLFFFISRFSRYKPASGRGVFLMRLFVEGMVSYWVKRGLAVDGLLEDSRKLTEIKKKKNWVHGGYVSLMMACAVCIIMSVQFCQK